MRKVFKKKVYSYIKPCKDDYGEYKFYFDIHLCLSSKGFYWTITTTDFCCCDKKLKNAMNRALEHLENDNPKYYRLKENLIKRRK